MISSGVWERDIRFGTNDASSTVSFVEIHYYFCQYLLIFHAQKNRNSLRGATVTTRPKPTPMLTVFGVPILEHRQCLNPANRSHCARSNLLRRFGRGTDL